MRCTLSAYPLTLTDARAVLGTRTDKRIGNNTTLRVRPDAGVDVVLHRTPILTFHADGTVTASTGGFFTATTAARLRALGVPLRVKRGQWLLDDAGSLGAPEPWQDGNRVALRTYAA